MCRKKHIHYVEHASKQHDGIFSKHAHWDIAKAALVHGCSLILEKETERFALGMVATNTAPGDATEQLPQRTKQSASVAGVAMHISIVHRCIHATHMPNVQFPV